MLLQLDFLQYQPALRISRQAGKPFVFDPARRKHVALTPEELLRQLVLQYLLQAKRYPLHRIRTEFGLTVNNLQKRCDILVYDAAVRPWLLIECKSPKVALSQAVAEQAAIYNLSLEAPFMALTNGLATFSCSIDRENKQVAFLDDLPTY